MLEQIVNGIKAREELKKGVDILVNAVACTLGPKGRNVIIYNKNNKPHITKDGVTVAKHISVNNKTENAAIEVLKQASLKTNENVGDGTTTSLVLAGAIYNFAIEYINEGSNPIDIKKGIEYATTEVIEEIKKRSILINNDINKLKKVCSISANNDNEIGELVANIIYNHGYESAVEVSESKSINTFVETCKGMKFDRGYLSHYFITDTYKNKVVLNNPYIFIVNKKINNIKEISNIIQLACNEQKNILLIATDFNDTIINTLAYYKVNNLCTIVPLKSPGYGDYRNEMLEDIAIATSAIITSPEMKIKLEDITVDFAGTAEIVIISKNDTIIKRKEEYNEKVNNRISEIKSLYKNCDSVFIKERYKERLTRLNETLITIYAGGATEVEIQEKKDRIEDAVCAAKAALEHGIVLGAGKTYMDIYYSIEKTTLMNDIYKGKSCVHNAILEPFNKIVMNSGKNPEDIKLSLKKYDNNCGYNASTDTIVNLFEEGILDSTKVACEAIQNASSAASTLLLTEYILTEVDDIES